GYGLWFLYCLLLISFIFWLTRRCRISGIALLGLGLALRAAAALNLCHFWPILNTACAYLIYFAIGAHFGKIALDRFERIPDYRILPFGLGAIVAMTAVQATAPGSRYDLSMLLALLGTLGLLSIAKALVTFGISRFWSYAGFHSLEVYLGHILLATLPRP